MFYRVLIVVFALVVSVAPATKATPVHWKLDQLCDSLLSSKENPSEATQPAVPLPPPLSVKVDGLEGINEDLGRSILFYKGDLPAEGTTLIKNHRYGFSYELRFIKNPLTGVVMIYCMDGVSHDELAKSIPSDGKIIGGVRYLKNPGHWRSPVEIETPSGTLFLINSAHFKKFDGVKVLNENFVLDFSTNTHP